MRRLLRIAVIVLVSAPLTSCMGWSGPAATLVQFVEQERPYAIRVTRRDGEELVLREPRVDGDSVRVSMERCEDAAPRSRRSRATCELVGESAIALHDVGLYEVRRLDGGRTLVSIGVTVAALYLALLATWGW